MVYSTFSFSRHDEIQYGVEVAALGDGIDHLSNASRGKEVWQHRMRVRYGTLPLFSELQRAWGHRCTLVDESI